MIDYNDFKLWDDFLATWPIDKIANMTLQQYTNVEDKTTFTYWLEHILRPYGSIRGGSAEKFAIFKKKNRDATPKSHLMSNDEYTWNPKYGSTPEQAFEKIHSLIIQVIEYIKSDNLLAIEAIDLPFTLKWKVAFHYQNRDKPRLVAIFNEKALSIYFNQSISIVEAAKRLEDQLSADTLMSLSVKIWTQWDNSKTATHDDNDNEEDMTSNKKEPLNQILYGPPGTGKTYHTIIKALDIIGVETEGKDRADLKKIFDEKVQAGQIVFTTFHQSMCYEDFIEGIKPNLDNSEVQDSVELGSDDSAELKYIIQPGIFKTLCDSIKAKVVASSQQKLVDIKNRTIWKMSLGNPKGYASWIYEQCIKDSYIALGYGMDVDFSTANKRSDIIALYQQKGFDIKSDYQVTSVDIFKNRMKQGDLVIISDGNHQFRAIAEITGNYEYNPDWISVLQDYSQLRKVIWHRCYGPSKPISDLFNKNLSQMTLYQLREPAINLDKLQALLAEQVEVHDDQEPRVLIIDEINRGNVSQIFGELITLIEEDKRLGNQEALTVTLPYSKEPFGVPNNLYIIGTMNTADRSVEALDSALRRRFSFSEMLPNPEYLKNSENIYLIIEDIVLADLLHTINQRLELLLDRDHQIGHSYLLNVTNTEQLCQAFSNKIIPLLQEYFFNDYAKICLVLGKGFVKQIQANIEFADDSHSDQEKSRYQLISINKDNIIAALKLMNIQSMKETTI